MADPVVIPCTIAGTDVADVDGIFLQPTLGMPGTLPGVRGEDNVAPGQPGRFVRNRVGDVRRIEYAGHVRGVATTEATDRADYWANRIALEALADPRTTVELRVTLGGTVYAITAWPIESAFDEQVPSFAYAYLVFESTTPDWEVAGS